ncbi:hypothetical protein FA13DRAFT_1643574, partial [Coprinellus micaceus]
NWRTNAQLFRPEHLCQVKRGVCYSPCWYEQGHTVSESIMNDPEAHQFLSDTQELSALLGGILSIIHPELYHQGMKVLRSIYDAPDDFRNPDLIIDTLWVWGSPFTAMFLISNRHTPLHRDLLGALNSFDVVMSWGEYDNGRFDIPATGMTFRYDSGTAIFLDTRTFKHGASAVVGERFCFVLFFRPLMLKHGLEEDEEHVDNKPLSSLGGLVRYHKSCVTVPEYFL